MTGNPVVKGNVTLSCKSSQGKPVPQYKWTKAAPMSEVFFSPMQSEYLNYPNGQFIQETKINDFIQVKSTQKGSDMQTSKYTALST